MVRKHIHRHLKSQENAWRGITELVITQANFDIELIVAAIVLITGIVIGLSALEWVIILFAISSVLFAEALNTAIERTCDAITTSYNENIRSAKDISAGMVIITALTSVIVGIVIFLPKLIALL